MSAQSSQFDPTDINQAVDTLRRGGVILYPTDTVWGIGCDATNTRAVSRIYQIKQRDDSKALITLVNSLAMLERTVAAVPEVAYQLIDVAVEPMTIVYDRGINVAPNLLASDGSIGVRVCTEGPAAAICRQLRHPIVSTSANLAGHPTPLCFGEISPEIINAVDYVCITGRLDPPAAKSSTVIKLSDSGVIRILRK